jgi:putative DNA primase/helicase
VTSTRTESTEEAEALRESERRSARLSPSDSGNALRFVDMHGTNAKYVREYAKWILWNGARWLVDGDGAVRLAKATARSIYSEAGSSDDSKELMRHARQSESLRAIEAMLKLARAEEGMTVSQGELDSDPMLLGAFNGTVDLRTGELVPAQRAHMISKSVATEFDPCATCPLFERVVAEIMGDNEELIAYLRRLTGYALTGQTSEQIIVFAHGTGANGKSTLLVTLRGVWGDYGAQTPSETLMSRRDEGIRNDIARLRAARLVTCNETEDGKRVAESMLKQLTGGDPITTRFLHKEYFEFVPKFKIILAANHRPIIRGSDDGIWRRIHLLPFTVSIPPERRDKTLSEKLRPEWPGILAWAVRGCLEWQNLGLAPPAEVVQATQDYHDEMDLIGRWIAEQCIQAPSVRVQVSFAFNDYVKWAESQGAHPMSMMSFSRKLEDRGYEKRKSGNMHFVGLGLKGEGDGAAGPTG